MKKILAVVAGGIVFFALSGSAVASEQKETQNAKKVILDTDMVEMFDDGVAMLMLMENPKIDLLGVVTVTGNTWANDGMAYLVRQLKAINKLD